MSAIIDCNQALSASLPCLESVGVQTGGQPIPMQIECDVKKELNRFKAEGYSFEQNWSIGSEDGALQI